MEKDKVAKPILERDNSNENAIPEVRESTQQTLFNDPDDLKSWTQDQPENDFQKPTASPPEDPNSKKQSHKELTVKITGRFEESIYEGKPEPLPADIQNPGVQETNDSGHISYQEKIDAQSPYIAKSEVQSISRQKSVIPPHEVMMPLIEQNNDVENIPNRFVGNQTSKVQNGRNDKSFSNNPFENEPKLAMTKSPRINFEDTTKLNFQPAEDWSQIEPKPIEANSAATSSPRQREDLHPPEVEIEDEKISQNSEQFRNNQKGSERRGAVTQGFIGYEEGKMHMRAQREQPQVEQRYVQETPYGQNMNVNNQGYGRYEHQYRPPFAYQTQLENPPEMAMPKDQENYNMVPVHYSHNAEARSSECLKTMAEMMNTMCAYNNSNFKIMMDSHTQIMSKLLDKVKAKKKSKRSRCEDST